jgi:hypothetical protein
MHRKLSVLAIFLLSMTTFSLAQSNPDTRQTYVDFMKEKQAFHLGTLAYLWGYPMVDMTKQMHNETNKIAAKQPVLAPINQFFRNENLITPSTAGELRAPNNDTLYLSGWFDLSQEPIVIDVPDTMGRYYTLAITDFFNEVTHLGRRTTGTKSQSFALVGPNWNGTLPPDVQAVNLATKRVWILGRIAVSGIADLTAARTLLRNFDSTPLSQWKNKQLAAQKSAPKEAAASSPMSTLAFFQILNQWLRDNHPRAGEESLVRMFDQIGIGPRSIFDPNKLDPASQKGLEAAIAEGQALLRASSQQPMPDVRNGWIFPLGLADYGENYLMRAAVAFGGYANRPQETVYAARTVDDSGQLMTGENRYRIKFPKGKLPPVGAFWSITAYDLKTFQLIENTIQRYSIGDRTEGLVFEADGSLQIDISHAAPPSKVNNWLPVGNNPFSLVVRMYEPSSTILNGDYHLPKLEKLK